MNPIEAAVIHIKSVINTGRGAPGRPNGFPLDGTFTRLLLIRLIDDSHLFTDFLKRAGLIPDRRTCTSCQRPMTWTTRTDLTDGFTWYCGKNSGGLKCRQKLTIRHGTWFSHSKLRLDLILALTYELINRTPTTEIIKQWGFSSKTVTDWSNFVKETLIEYVETNSTAIGGPGKIVEIDESKFGKRKYNRGHLVEGQWAFGGVERDSGKLFLVAVPDRTADTLTDLIRRYILPETTVHCASWKAYDRLGQTGYTDLKDNHSLNFIETTTHAHTNLIESTWRDVKATLPTYKRLPDFQTYLADFIFTRLTRQTDEDRFTKFLQIIVDIDRGKTRMTIQTD